MRENLKLLTENLDLLTEWPTIKQNKTAMAELNAIREDAENYNYAMASNFSSLIRSDYIALYECL